MTWTVTPIFPCMPLRKTNLTHQFELYFLSSLNCWQFISLDPQLNRNNPRWHHNNSNFHSTKIRWIISLTFEKFTAVHSQITITQFEIFIIIIQRTKVWFGLVYLFNGTSISYSSSNAEIQFIYKCLIIIITIFITMYQISVLNCTFLFVYNRLFAVIYSIKYSDPINYT